MNKSNVYVAVENAHYLMESRHTMDDLSDEQEC